jgi:predicted hydrolase (HD superfamily)
MANSDTKKNVGTRKGLCAFNARIVGKPDSLIFRPFEIWQWRSRSPPLTAKFAKEVPRRTRRNSKLTHNRLPESLREGGIVNYTGGLQPIGRRIHTREAAWNLLTEFTQSESLRKHALAVEACMRACSRKFGNGSAEDEALWGIVGLVHDFDYERWPTPEEHPYKGNEILKERGYSDEIRRAIMSHAEYSGVSRDTPMEKALFACDELAGFITAVALIKPGKSLAEVDVKSVRKRMKDKAFARKVNRDDIINGAADLGVDLDEHIAFCIEALKPIAKELGLDGSAVKPAQEDSASKLS